MRRGALIERPRLSINELTLRQEGAAQLAPTARTILLYLVEKILARGSYYVEGQGEIAAACRCSRMSVSRATAKFRALKLILATPTKQQGGGTDKMCWRLAPALWRVFAGCNTELPPNPKGNANSTSKALPGEVESADADPNDFAGALARALGTARIGDADRRVCVQIAASLPPDWRPAALALARWIGGEAGAGIVAPGAFLRQRLADLLRMAGVPVPEAWRVKISPPAVVVRAGELGIPGFRKGDRPPPEPPAPTAAPPVAAVAVPASSIGGSAVASSTAPAPAGWAAGIGGIGGGRPALDTPEARAAYRRALWRNRN